MTRLAEITVPAAPSERRPLRLARECLAGALFGGLALPAFALVGTPMHASAVTAILAALLASLVALCTWRAGAQGIPAVVVSTIAVLTGCFLLVSASYPGSGFVVTALLGAGLGPLLPRSRKTARSWAPSAFIGVATLAIWTDRRFQLRHRARVRPVRRVKSRPPAPEGQDRARDPHTNEADS